MRSRLKNNHPFPFVKLHPLKGCPGRVLSKSPTDLRRLLTLIKKNHNILGKIKEFKHLSGCVKNRDGGDFR